MTTIRQAVVKYNSYRPHQWYTLDEIVSAYYKMRNESPIESEKNTRKQYFIVTNKKHRWNDKVVTCDMRPNDDGLVKISIGSKIEHIHQMFLRPCKPQLGTLQQQSL